ncbi:DUF5133 domain-containing protein [Streptomyces sp. NPDC002564]|uniref:DUF5133 domain-containing protein n=1 Tax=Streptomyces sp. NPDC002564 TaxID=3364649 RepID=UPI00367FD62E
MLKPTATDTRAALARFADRMIADLCHSTAGSRRRRQESADALCVLTGTGDLATALATADEILQQDWDSPHLKRTAP